jgi:hypothetical protein
MDCAVQQLWQSGAQHSTAQHSTAQHSIADRGTCVEYNTCSQPSFSPTCRRKTESACTKRAARNTQWACALILCYSFNGAPQAPATNTYERQCPLSQAILLRPLLCTGCPTGSKASDGTCTSNAECCGADQGAFCNGIGSNSQGKCEYQAKAWHAAAAHTQGQSPVHMSYVALCEVQSRLHICVPQIALYLSNHLWVDGMPVTVTSMERKCLVSDMAKD